MKHIKKFNESFKNVSYDDIKKWVDENIGYYDPDDCEWPLLVDQATDDMTHDFKTHYLNIDLDESFDMEEELINYFKQQWELYYNEN